MPPPPLQPLEVEEAHPRYRKCFHEDIRMGAEQTQAVYDGINRVVPFLPGGYGTVTRWVKLTLSVTSEKSDTNKLHPGQPAAS